MFFVDSFRRCLADEIARADAGDALWRLLVHQKAHHLMYNLMLQTVQRKGPAMRTTVTIDDELFETASAYTGITEKSALVREALKQLVHREASRRLARLGGSEPHLKDVPRRRVS